jgi:hypothetical protein
MYRIPQVNAVNLRSLTHGLVRVEAAREGLVLHSLQTACLQGSAQTNVTGLGDLKPLRFY